MSVRFCHLLLLIPCRYLHVLLINLTSPKPTVVSSDTLTDGQQPCLTIEELCDAEAALREDPAILARLDAMDIKPEELCCDGWTIGYDERFPATRRVQQCMTFARFQEDSNMYAHPLDFYPVSRHPLSRHGTDGF